VQTSNQQVRGPVGRSLLGVLCLFVQACRVARLPPSGLAQVMTAALESGLSDTFVFAHTQKDLATEWEGMVCANALLCACRSLLLAAGSVLYPPVAP
jgi:hypothetical protein